MTKVKNHLIFVFAVIEVCAVAYSGWHFYERHVANVHAKSAFSAPPAEGVPDMYHNAPPPPQP